MRVTPSLRFSLFRTDSLVLAETISVLPSEYLSEFIVQDTNVVAIFTEAYINEDETHI